MRFAPFAWLGTGVVVAGAIVGAFAMLPPAVAGARPAGASGGFAPDGRWLVAYHQWIAENGAFDWPLGASHLAPSLESSQREADEQWARIAEWNPDAIRPDVDFVSWTTRPGADTDLARCITAVGVTVKESVDADGRVDGMEFSYSGDSPDVSVPMFACQRLAHPSPPVDFWDGVDREWRYYRDVVSPCLEAHGVGQRPLPEFELQLELVLRYGVGWTPTLPEANGDRIIVVCRPHG